MSMRHMLWAFFGPAGRGLVAESSCQDFVTVSAGTCSKALGGYGGFVACTSTLRELLINKARSFIYNTSFPASLAAAGRASLMHLRDNPGLGRTLLENASVFRLALQSFGFDTCKSESHIVPIVIGDAETAVAFSNALWEERVCAAAIRPPTVPQGTSRIRFSISLGHTSEELERVATLVEHTGKRFGVV